MFRRIALVAAAAAAAMLSFASVASAAPVARAAPSLTSCASGWFTISNAGLPGYAITGQGVNLPVLLTTSGNCFETLYPFTYAGETGYEYQNGDGHCLWYDAGFGDEIQMGAACKPGHPNEEFYAIKYSGGGWTVGNIGASLSDVMDAQYCQTGPSVVMDTAPAPACDKWNF